MIYYNTHSGPDQDRAAERSSYETYEYGGVRKRRLHITDQPGIGESDRNLLIILLN